MGSAITNDPLVAFLYELTRDHVPPGVINGIIQGQGFDNNATNWKLTDPHITMLAARWAAEISAQSPKSTIDAKKKSGPPPYAKKPEPSSKEQARLGELNLEIRSLIRSLLEHGGTFRTGHIQIGSGNHPWWYRIEVDLKLKKENLELGDSECSLQRLEELKRDMPPNAEKHLKEFETEAASKDYVDRMAIPLNLKNLVEDDEDD